MAIPIADRVKDATTTTGTANVILANTAPAGYMTFLQGFGSSSSKQVCYCISNPNSPYEWETGFGVYTSSTNTLVRNIVTATSVAGSTTKINFPAGTKDVFCTTPSSSMLVINGNGDIVIPTVNTSALPNISPELSPAGYSVTSFTISCPTSTLSAQTGTYLAISSGDGTTTGDAGYLDLTAGNAPGSGLGGDIYITSGGSVTGGGGIVQIIAGDGGGSGGDINLTAGGVPSSYAGNGGNISIDSGIALGSGSNGYVLLSLGGVPAIKIQPADATTTAPVKIGFFGATPVVKPTGVAVTAAAIHTALVSLGLIAA